MHLYNSVETNIMYYTAKLQIPEVNNTNTCTFVSILQSKEFKIST